MKDVIGGSLTILRSYVFGNEVDEPLALRVASTGTYYQYFQDRQHNVVTLIDADTAAIVERYGYYPFGEMKIDNGQGTPDIPQSAFGNSLGYAGRWYDVESLLWQFRGRDYSPQHGRFLQRDPAGYVDGYNLYAYVMNNPMKYVDPSGRFKVGLGNDGYELNLTQSYQTGRLVMNSPSSAPAGFYDWNYAGGAQTLSSLTNPAAHGLNLAPPRAMAQEMQLQAFNDQYQQFQRQQAQQMGGTGIRAQTSREQQLLNAYPQANVGVQNAWDYQANNQPVPRQFQRDLDRYELRIGQLNTQARQQQYLDHTYSDSIGGRFLAGADSFLNPAWNGQGNINDFTVAVAPFAMAAEVAPAKPWVSSRAGGRVDPVYELEVGRVGELQQRSYRDGLTPDHIPSFAAIKANGRITLEVQRRVRG